jgi:hypothetical protein
MLTSISITYLQDEQGQEVEVGSPLELLKQVEWDEGDGVVLVGLDAVPLVPEIN